MFLQDGSQSPQIGACLRTLINELWRKGKHTQSQSPQIGACLRTDAGQYVPPEEPMSQSPQIGACLRTGHPLVAGGSRVYVSIPSNRGLPSDYFEVYAKTGAYYVSIPSNRGLPSDACISFQRLCSRHVSIPSNRGLPSDIYDAPKAQWTTSRLNPLKSGPAFGPSGKTMKTCPTTCLNPLKSGPAFGRKLSLQHFPRSPAVSIPSNRGLPSDTKMISSTEMELICLNPLKSGPAFGPHLP